MIIIDLTPYRCPLPLVKVKLALKQLSAGDCIRVVLSDPGSRQDVPRYLKKAGYCHTVEQDNDAILSITVSK
ncbi:sulfurtransferase TusA family protein [Shewanella schlegeliana]|uniref:Sulfurtransferase TusA family protein n=1 Tax=Shewanella schlegeliana TaxID=190308 RepID=A0ABS1SZ07_9GAMM|nr:sulfurtransferase TusA family protein [Shewanella schlegeliana]MBL4913785.1 sulfurtransferase TusA family protein [Shewanella schlegeliana]MCL1108830.1 sulfurtransferase TusA family protein [Shewanella schlegeliana]GIU25845.1 transcriptional regulator [Shewanella schlegeliana]